MKRAAVIVIALLTLSWGAFASEAGTPMPMKEHHSTHHHGYHVKKGNKYHIQKKKRAIREYRKYIKAKRHYQAQRRKMKRAEYRFLRNHRKMNGRYYR